MNDSHGRGFVLARDERGEADLSVVLLLDDGRVLRAHARGAARSSRRFSAGLSPFTLYRFVFARGRGATTRLEEAFSERVFPALLTDLRRMGAAAAAGLMVRDLAGEGSEDAAVFHLYAGLLEGLARAGAEGTGAALLRFAFALFERAGHPIVLDACVRCGRAVPDNALVHLHPGAGGVVCAACGGGPLTLRAADRRATLALLEGDDASFRATMLHWAARMLGAHARRGAEAVERATGYWAS